MKYDIPTMTAEACKPVEITNQHSVHQSGRDASR